MSAHSRRVRSPRSLITHTLAVSESTLGRRHAYGNFQLKPSII